MKFKIQKGTFENIIASMQPFLEKKDASAITSHIFLEVDNKLIIRSTDYEMGLESTVKDIEIEEIGKATVNGSNLLGIIRRLKNSDINLEIENNTNLLISQGKSKFKLPMYDANEYPSFPQLANLEKLDIKTVDLIHSIKKIIPSIDSNNPKFELNGALIDIKSNSIHFVSTDTRRLSVSKENNSGNKEQKLIIPKKAIIEISKLFLDEADINFDETNLVISTENRKFFTKLINGNFPDYNRIIPNNLKYTLTIPKNQLIESIKLVTSIFSNIKITFLSDGILFESLDEESEAITKIDFDLQIQESFYIAANAKYLLDFLSTVENENVMIGYNESNLPFYLEDGDFFTIIMPIVLDK